MEFYCKYRKKLLHSIENKVKDIVTAKGERTKC